MEWLLAGVGAVAGAGVGWLLGYRGGRERALQAVGELAEELRRGAVRSAGPSDPPALAGVRRALNEGWSPQQVVEGSPEALLRRVTRYLDEAVRTPLKEGLDAGGPGLRRAVRAALDAVEDLAFHAEVRPVVDRARENLTRAVQEVMREYASEFSTPVRLRAPDQPVEAALDTEAFKDALYMVLVNGGRFGGPDPVEIVLEPQGREIRILVRDRGPGFSHEALERALEPFWSSEPGALGLGLTHVRQVVLAHGGDLRLRNREEGGGEVEILLPRG